MPLILTSVLWPFRWLLETLLVAGHALLGDLGLPYGAGATWLLAILLLLVVVRVAVLPLAVFATKNTREVVLLTDVLAEIRTRHEGRDDAESRRAEIDEVRAARQATSARQVRSIVPQLIQGPIFAALYAVLRAAETGRGSAGPLTPVLAHSFTGASVGGIPLSASPVDGRGDVWAVVLGLTLTLVVAVSQFATQALSLRFNTTEQAKRSPLWRYRPTPLFVSPVVVVAASVTVPLGLLFHLAASSLWTLGQQGFLLWRHPLPTTRAHRAHEQRHRSRGRHSTTAPWPSEPRTAAAPGRGGLRRSAFAATTRVRRGTAAGGPATRPVPAPNCELG